MHKPSSEDQCRDSSPSPLERRDSFGMLCAGDESLSGPDDEPRNIFMKLGSTKNQSPDASLQSSALRHTRLAAAQPLNWLGTRTADDFPFTFRRPCLRQLFPSGTRLPRWQFAG